MGASLQCVSRQTKSVPVSQRFLLMVQLCGDSKSRVCNIAHVVLLANLALRALAKLRAFRTGARPSSEQGVFLLLLEKQLELSPLKISLPCRQQKFDGKCRPHFE